LFFDERSMLSYLLYWQRTSHRKMAIVMLLSCKLDFEDRRGRLLVSESFKTCPVHFLRIATSVAISLERKCPPQSASPDSTTRLRTHIWGRNGSKTSEKFEKYTRRTSVIPPTNNAIIFYAITHLEMFLSPCQSYISTMFLLLN
jgi:hypothetical protein